MTDQEPTETADGKASLTADAEASLTADSVREILTAAIGQIRFARNYTLELLDATPEEHWYKIPDGLPSSIAWQVGHLTVSQYGLLLFRLRGRVPEDLELIPGRFRKGYGRGSNPKPDAEGQPSIDELRSRMNQVFDLGMEQLAKVDTDVLLEPIEMPYAVYPNKLGTVLFCPLHEHIHAGQIGVLRRALGLDPVR